ncbi:MAG: hypothetical protein Q9165_004941 [Trypethelium subeluteriae]
MPVPKRLITLLVTAALTTFTFAAVHVSSTTYPDKGLPHIKTSNATWDKTASLYYGGQSKHDLEVRTPKRLPSAPPGFTRVPMGKSKGENSPRGLWTFGLYTCFGIGVTGTPKNHTEKSRFLMHYMISRGEKARDQWDTFQQLVEDARLQDIKGWLSIPDLSQQLPTGWSQKDTELMDLVIKEMVQKVTDLIGKAPKTVLRPMAMVEKDQFPYGIMQIDQNNSVEIDGHRVTQ